jgi:hypothetical protein
MKGILHHAVHELENPADKLRVPVQDTVAIKRKR